MVVNILSRRPIFTPVPSSPTESCVFELLPPPSQPLQALPPYKAREQFRLEGLESYKWGEKKRAKSQAAIDAVGKAWLREALMEQPSLEEFLV